MEKRARIIAFSQEPLGKRRKYYKGTTKTSKKGEGESFLPRLIFVFSRMQSIRLAAYSPPCPWMIIVSSSGTGTLFDRKN